MKEITGSKKWYLVAFLVFVLVLLDQISKYFVQEYLMLSQRYSLTSFFDLTHVLNKGAAFSFLSNAGGWQNTFFIVFSIVMIGWILLQIYQKENHLLMILSLSFIVGGAIGNLIDRFIVGAVVDFLLFYWPPYAFPVFNIADSAITVGAILLIVYLLKAAKLMRYEKSER